MSKREYIYGITPCLAALRANRRKIFKVFLNDKLLIQTPKREQLLHIVEESKAKDHMLKYKSRGILDRLTMNRPHQNVVMYAGKLSYEKLGKHISPTKKEELWLALDQVHDPMNFGAIIRSATYFGVDKIIVTENNCCGLTPVVSKASAGTMESKIVYSTGSLEKMLKTCQKEGWQVVGTMQSDDETPAPSKEILSSHNISITKPTILVMGNEGYGLSSSIIPFCNKFITIPPSENSCPVGLDSLNVSVATGILLHSLTKQRCSGSILT